MKNNLFFVLLLTAFSYSYCDDFFWKWDDFDNKQWERYLLHHNNKDDYHPCREPESKKIGVVNKATGQCFLPGSGERVESYQIINKTFPDYLGWLPHEFVSCYSALNSQSEPKTEGSSKNCIDDSERLCRFKSNDVWVFGVENKRECVHSEHIRAYIYELYAFNIFKYQLYELMNLQALAIAIWMAALGAIYCGTYVFNGGA